MNDPVRPRRPLYLGPQDLEARGDLVDPVREIEAAHESAAVLVRSGRAGDDPQLTHRLVGIVDELGLATVARLWAERPARSLPGALWRLYALREWVHLDPALASREYAAGVKFAGVEHVVAGAAEPPGPDQLIALVDAVLHGVFDGDLAVALQRAASFCRVVSAGRAEVGEGERSALGAAALLATATDLDAAAGLWRRGDLV